VKSVPTGQQIDEEYWLRTLRRRGQKDCFTWERIKRLANDWLPQPRTLHPWPSLVVYGCSTIHRLDFAEWMRHTTVRTGPYTAVR
jgi:hypothetical protein